MRRALPALLGLLLLAPALPAGARVVSPATAGGGAVVVVGEVRPWGDAAHDATFRFLPAPEALREVYAGRADVALVARPGPGAPPGVAPPAWLPVGVRAARVAYRLPGVDLRLDVPTVCAILDGRVLAWNDPALRRLNPCADLPALPILATARTKPNGASLAFADACVAVRAWPPARRGAAWGGRAATVRPTRAAQLADLRLTGALGVLDPDDDAPGTRDARLLAPGGTFVPPAAELGLDRAGLLPRSPWETLRAPNVPGAYPLRGPVWAVFARERRFRGRSEAAARGLADWLARLQAARAPNVAPLPDFLRPGARLLFGGKPLR